MVQSPRSLAVVPDFPRYDKRRSYGNARLGQRALGQLVCEAEARRQRKCTGALLTEWGRSTGPTYGHRLETHQGPRRLGAHTRSARARAGGRAREQHVAEADRARHDLV